jgi:hypothetical protein
MDVDEHERLSNNTGRYKVNERNVDFVVVLHFCLS